MDMLSNFETFGGLRWDKQIWTTKQRFQSSIYELDYIVNSL
jgi:hypothetical protein